MATTAADQACDYCGGNSAFARYDLGTHRILRCPECTFMWLDPQPTADELHEVYGEDYYSNQRFYEGNGEAIYGYHDYVSERFVKQQDHQRIVDRIVEFLSPDGDGAHGERTAPGLLDIGCGYGYLLDVAHDRGFDVEGIDCNRTAVDRIARKYRFRAVCGDFMAYDGATRDVVTMMDVIEHLPRPFDALSKAASLTRPGGIFALSTMDSDSIVSRMLGQRLEDFRRTREHLYFFNRRTMRGSLERAGFDVMRIDSYGLTIRIDSLARRARMALPRAGAVMERMVRWSGLSAQQVHFDPRTKMVVYARRRDPA